jgi:hypothetical protein
MFRRTALPWSSGRKVQKKSGHMWRQDVLNGIGKGFRGKHLMVTMKPRPLHFTLVQSCYQNWVSWCQHFAHFSLIYYTLLVVTDFTPISLYSLIIFYFIFLQHIFYDSTFTSNLFPHHSQYTKAPPSDSQPHHHSLDNTSCPLTFINASTYTIYLIF